MQSGGGERRADKSHDNAAIIGSSCQARKLKAVGLDEQKERESDERLVWSHIPVTEQQWLSA